MSTSETELVSSARKGDRTSFDLLVRRHYTLVYNTAYRILGDASTAEDATQAAFIRAFRSLPRFRGSSAFSTWLYRIVSNVCLDTLRARKDNVTSIDVAFDGEDSHERPLPDSDTEPAAVFEQTERQRAVHRAISVLSEDHRMVLVLYDISGFSYEEVAAILEMPLGTVKSRLNRARIALKDILADSMELFE